MRLNPHLAFNGQCEAAFKFYQQCLGGEIAVMMAYEDSPEAARTPPEWRKKIIHATLDLGDDRLTGGDALPGQYQRPAGISVLLGLDDAAEADRVFAALAENGAVQMPIQETFWAARFGVLVDQFGTPWLINCGKSA
jgi:PhnB protein